MRVGGRCAAMAIIFLLALPLPAVALIPRPCWRNTPSTTGGPATGLPQASVRAIAQTADGYIWLGTEEGLVRFDGVRFTVFDTTNSA